MICKKTVKRMRLIDADALQDEIQKSKMQNPHKDAKTATNHELEHDHFMQMVVLQPTAQEEIVRCKECKFYTDPQICPVFGMDRYDDWFCADGERR